MWFLVVLVACLSGYAAGFSIGKRRGQEDAKMRLDSLLRLTQVAESINISPDERLNGTVNVLKQWRESL